VPTISAPTLCYFVCSNPRSGTSLLCDALKATGLAGRPEEYFWRGDVPFWTERWGVSSEEDYLAAMLREGTTPNGVFGAKVMQTYFLDDVVAPVRRIGKSSDPVSALLERTFPNLHYIALRRRDHLAQAISWVRASQTNVWTRRTDAPLASGVKPHFDVTAIDNLVGLIERGEVAWQQYFDEAGITPLEIVYEDLIRCYEETIRHVLDFLGVPIPESFSLPTPSIIKQADDLSAEWIERYRQIRGI
jgi:LPS sulfotransferase NodH